MPRGLHRQPSQLTTAQILAYANYQVSAQELADQIGYNYSQVLSWLRQSGVKIHRQGTPTAGRKRSRPNPLTEDDVLAYETHQITTKELNTKYQAGLSTTTKWLREKHAKKQPRPLPPEESPLTEEDKSFYRDRLTTLEKLAQKHQSSAYHVKLWLTAAGINTAPYSKRARTAQVSPTTLNDPSARMSGNHKLPNELTDQDVREYEALTVSIRSIAEKRGKCPSTVRKWLREKGVKIHPIGTRYQSHQSHQHNKLRMPSKLTTTDTQEYIERRTTSTKLSLRHKVSVHTILRWLRDAQIQIHPKGRPNSDECYLTKEELLQLINRTTTVAALARKHKTTDYLIRKQLKHKPLKTEPRETTPNGAQPCTDSPANSPTDTSPIQPPQAPTGPQDGRPSC